MFDVPAIPRFAMLTGAMVVLAGLDFCGALLAKQWADRGSLPCFLIGIATFAVLFAVYAKSLETADLSIVTMGWVVLLQVGLILVDPREQLEREGAVFVSLPSGERVRVQGVEALLREGG